MSMDDQGKDYSKLSWQRNKALRQDYDFVQARSEDKCLYCFSDQEITILLGMMDYIGWQSRWYSLIETPIDQEWLDNIQAEITSELMTDNCDIRELLENIDDELDAIKTELDDVKSDTTSIKADTATIKTDTTTLKVDTGILKTAVNALELHLLAQDAVMTAIGTLLGTIDAALALLAAAVAGIAAAITSLAGVADEIDEDVDNIEDIITDTDDGLFEVSEDVDNIELLVQKIKTGVITINNFTTVIQNYYSFVGNVNDNSDVKNFARYNGLCMAVKDWLYYEFYVVLQGLSAGLTNLDSVFGSIVINTVWFLQEYGSAGYDETDIMTAIGNTSAVDAVVCHMVTYLQDKDVTYGNFALALDTFSPSNSDETLLTDILSLAITQFDAFSAFAAVLETYFQAALALNPTSYDCPSCGTIGAYCSTSETWDFTLGQKIPWFIYRGVYQPGVGIVGVAIPGDTNLGMDMKIIWPTPCTTILSHHIEVSHAHLSNVGNSFFVEWEYLLSGIPTNYNRASVSQSTAWPGLDVQSIAVPTPPGSVGVYSFRWCINTPYYAAPGLSNNSSAASKVTKIRLIT